MSTRWAEPSLSRAHLPGARALLVAASLTNPSQGRGREEMQIANAVCKSRIIGVVTEVILEHASDGIGQEPGSNETHLPRARKERARFLVQLELILEVVEHRSTCTRVLPVFLVCCLCFSVSTRVSRQRRSGPCCARFTGPDAGPRRRRKERKALLTPTPPHPLPSTAFHTLALPNLLVYTGNVQRDQRGDGGGSTW